MSDEIPPEHQQIDADLNAWGRWSSSKRSGYKSACGSAEGNYNAPWRQWHYPTAEEMMPRMPLADMLAIDRAILGLPHMYLNLVRCHYAFRLQPRKTRLRLAIAQDAWDEHLHRARQMVLNRLRSREKPDSVPSCAVQAIRP